MTELRKFRTIGISALFLAASAFLVFGGPLGTLAFADTPVTAVVVSAVNEIDRTTEVSTIEVNNGTIRMIATLTPFSPSDASVVWTVENGTGLATIDRCGQLFAVTNGTVTAVGTSHSNPAIYGQMVITISNQLQPIDLGLAGDFAVLAKAGISTTGATHITGDVGVSPAAGTYLTGFDLAADSSGTFSTSAYVTGQLFAANDAEPTPSYLTTAVSNMETALTTGMGLAPTYVTELYNGDLSGKTLLGGVYKWGTNVLINDDVTLYGDAHDVWVFQISGMLTEADHIHVSLSGGALPQNVFWIVADTVAVGVGAHFEGNILAQTDIGMGTGSSINGRLLAQTAITLNATTVAFPS